MTDPHGIPGWDKVDALAKALLQTTGVSLTPQGASEIIKLWSGLEPYDKRPVTYAPIHQASPTGRFARNRSGCPGDAQEVCISEFLRLYTDVLDFS